MPKLSKTCHKLTIQLLVLLAISFSGLPAYAKYGGGTGEPNDPYLIFDANQMNTIGVDSNDWDKCFKLMADIDLGGYTGDSLNIIGNDTTPFTGVFDGNSHTISNFTYDSTDADYIGVFGLVGHWENNGEIKDLGLVDPNVNAGSGDYVGSLVGYSLHGIITCCYADGGSVSGDNYVGGLVGSSISYRERENSMSNCYAISCVVGNNIVGGLVGYNDDYGTITNCYSAGNVSGNSVVGGLVGENDGLVFDCYWDVNKSGQSNSGAGTGKTTAEMQTANTFIGWGCELVWTIDAGVDYPRLWWEDKPGELITSPSYGGGTGEPNDPYLIYTAEQLNMIGLVSCDLDAHFKLMADIDLSAYSGEEFNIIGDWISYRVNRVFTGVFDGNDHTISNFTYDSNGVDYIGIFGYVNDPNSEIRNLGLVDPNLNGGVGRYIGGVVGSLYRGAVVGCYVEGGWISGRTTVGGLVGDNMYGEISNSYCTVTVSGYGSVGGLVGHNYGGEILNSYAAGSISGDGHVGGLVGSNYRGKVSSSYSEATVSGDRYIGGLAGGNQFGEISNSYSAGVVSGNSYVGGFIGSGEKSVGCFWDIEASGQMSSAGGKGSTTAEMQTASTFTSWGGCGNEGIWVMDDGNDYPRLWWEGRGGESLPAYQLCDFISGSGEPYDPYLICTAEEFSVLSQFYCEWDKSFKLMSDIDLSSFSENNSNVIGIGKYYPFTGSFDGNGHKILNFRYESNGSYYAGVFGYILDPDAKIMNLGVVDPVNVGTLEWCGGLVGWFGHGTVQGCYVEGGNISGHRHAGGLVGYLGGTVSECYVENCNVSGNYHIAGLAGVNYGNIVNSYSTGTVSGNYNFVGGLVGENRGVGGHVTISNSYSMATVSGDRYVGGLAGYNLYGEISGSYSTGAVSGNDYVGGLVGRTYHGTVTGSFWDTQTSGRATSAGGTGKTTTEMQTESTFTDAGWDFSTPIWKMNCEGMSYPKLNWWQPVLGDFDCPDGVDMRDFAILAAQWRLPPGEPSADIAPNGGDNIVDRFDLAALADNWLAGF